MTNIYEVLCLVKASIGCNSISLGMFGVCRFCKCDDPEKFRKKAHTIPEALGNKWITSLDECDDCNIKYGRYEEQLVKALRPILTLGGVKGKTGVPQTGRTRGSYIRHSNESGRRRISTCSQAELTDVLSKSSTPDNILLKIPVHIEKFTPLLAYKALVKIAIALLPKEELKNFQKVVNWLDNDNDRNNQPPCIVGVSFALIGNSPPLVSGVLYKRNSPNTQLPYMIFILCVGSICLQIRLKSDEYDNHTVEEDFLQIQWSIKLATPEGSHVKYIYENPVTFYWSESAQIDNPIEAFMLQFDPETTEGSFKPIMRNHC